MQKHFLESKIIAIMQEIYCKFKATRRVLGTIVAFKYLKNIKALFYNISVFYRYKS